MGCRYELHTVCRLVSGRSFRAHGARRAERQLSKTQKRSWSSFGGASVVFAGPERITPDPQTNMACPDLHPTPSGVLPQCPRTHRDAERQQKSQASHDGARRRTGASASVRDIAGLYSGSGSFRAPASPLTVTRSRVPMGSNAKWNDCSACHCELCGTER